MTEPIKPIYGVHDHQAQLVIPLSQNPPAAPIDGSVYIDTDENRIYAYRQGQWVAGDAAHVADLAAHPPLLRITDAAATYSPLAHTHASETTFYWAYDDVETMADPGSGDVRTNTTAGTPPTQVAFSDITTNNIDASNVLASLTTGDVIFFQQQTNANNWGRYAVSGAPTDNTTWWQVPVSAIETHGSAITKNQNVMVKFTYGTGGGGEGVSDHGLLTGLSDDDHTQYALANGTRGTFEVAGAVATHAGLPDPHTGYQLETGRNAANGYAGLDGSTKLLYAQIPTGTAASTIAIGDHTHTSSTISALDAGDTTTGTFVIGLIPTGTSSTTVSLGNHLHAGVYDTAGTAAAAITTHEAATDPHPSYLKVAEVLAGSNVSVTDNANGTLTIAASSAIAGPAGPSGQSAGKILYYAISDASDISTYKTLLTSPSAASEQTISTPCTGTSDFLIAAFATDPGVIGAVDYPAGTAFRRIYANVGSGIGRLHLQVYKRDAGGTETLIRDEYSENFSDQAPALQEWIASSAAAGALLATDRIVNKLYAQRVSGTTTVTVTTYFEGTSHGSHIQTTISAGPQGPAGVGVPTGGTTGQLLAKNSATDYDTEWIAPGPVIVAQSSAPGDTSVIWIDTT